MKIRKEKWKRRKKEIPNHISRLSTFKQRNGNNTSTFYMPMKRKVKTSCLNRHPISNNNQLCIAWIQHLRWIYILDIFSPWWKECEVIYPSEAFEPRSRDYPCFKRHSRGDPSQEVVFQPNTKIPPSCSQIPNTLLQRLGNQYHGPHRYNKIKKCSLNTF